MRRQQLLERVRGVELRVPVRDTSRERTAERHLSCESTRVELRETRRDESPHGVAPGNHPLGLADFLIEQVQQRDLVPERFLDGPSGRRIGRAGSGKVVAEQPGTSFGGRGEGGVAAAGSYVTMAVQE